MTRAQADLDRASAHHSALEKAFRPVAMYQPKVLVGHYTSMDGPDCGTVYPLYANCEAQIRGWTLGPDRETVIADIVAKLEADRIRNIYE
ncbi:MAG: hypothetical protein JWL62_3733, partial [Hyphomicrobiales bacterium]|nr:hypothetical protein [Hyphomicrobiales bacterium]